MAWAPNYATTDDLRAYLAIPDVQDDVELSLALTAASRVIDQTCNRQFGSVSAEDRYYTARRENNRWVIDIDDLMTTAGLIVSADLSDTGDYSDAVTEYAMRPINAAAHGRPWTKIVVHPTSDNFPNGADGAVEVRAAFGWTAVPDTIQQACLLQASRFFKRKDAPFGVAGSPEMGSEVRLLARIDPDVAVMVQPYVRWWAVA